MGGIFWSLALSHDGRHVAVSDGKTVKVFNTEDGKSIYKNDDLPPMIEVAFCPTHPVIALGGPKEVRVINWQSGVTELQVSLDQLQRQTTPVADPDKEFTAR
jgi:hypothetical protein